MWDAAGPWRRQQRRWNGGWFLYERLGGVDAITAVVRAVVDRQMKDDRINQKFARTNVDRLRQKA
jgi:hypothetical protein